MITATDYATHRTALVDLGNTLQDAECDLERFFDDDDLDAGHELVSRLKAVHYTLTSLIADVEADVTAAESGGERA